MAKLETEHVFDGTLEEVFGAIGKFDLYPEYLPGVQTIDVTDPEAENSTAQVRYDLKIIKEFFYTLDMFTEENKRIYWTLAGSNIMKLNNGSWEFSKKSAKKTLAKYCIEIKFKGLIPSAITDKIAQANLPAMFEGFQKLINDSKES